MSDNGAFILGAWICGGLILAGLIWAGLIISAALRSMIPKTINNIGTVRQVYMTLAEYEEWRAKEGAPDAR